MRAWDQGDEAIEQALPDPVTDFASWQTAQHDRWGVPPAACDRLTMRSRFYAAFTVGRSLTRPPLGVIVYESLDAFDAAMAQPAKLNPSSLRKKKHPEIQRLLELLALVGM